MESYCITQGTHLHALQQPGWVGWQGMEAQLGEDICILRVDSHCCIAETKQHCKAIIFQIKINFKNKNKYQRHFHKTKTNNSKICTETEKTLNCQRNLKKEEQNWRNHEPRFQLYYKEAIVIKTVKYW